MECHIVLDMVNDLDQEPIPFPCYDSRPRDLTIDGNDALCSAQPRHILQLDLYKERKKETQRRFWV
jgi:hypothetical protein